MESPKPKEISIFSPISINTGLMDTRSGFYGLKFGKIKDICRQYGLKYKIHKTCIEIYGPQSRMRFIIEKLHFSRKPYSSNSY